MTTTPEHRTDLGATRAGTAGRRATTIAAATASGLLIWMIAVQVADVDLTVGSGANAQQVGAGAVAVNAVLAGLAASGLAAVLPRVTSRPRRAWLAVAGAVLVLSLFGVLGAVSAGAGAVLVALHLVVGATLILGIGATVQATSPAPST